MKKIYTIDDRYDLIEKLTIKMNSTNDSNSIKICEELIESLSSSGSCDYIIDVLNYLT